MNEAALERSVRDLLRWSGAWLLEWAFRPGADTAAKAGTPDIVGSLPGGRFLACELKSPKTRRDLTPTQRETLVAIWRAGGKVLVARRLEDVAANLDGVEVRA